MLSTSINILQVFDLMTANATAQMESQAGRISIPKKKVFYWVYQILKIYE